MNAELAAVATVLGFFVVFMLAWPWVRGLLRGHAGFATPSAEAIERLERARWNTAGIRSFHLDILATASTYGDFTEEAHALTPEEFRRVWKAALQQRFRPPTYLRAFRASVGEAARFHLYRRHNETTPNEFKNYMRAEMGDIARYRLPADHGLVPLLQAYDLPAGNYFIRLESETHDGVTIPAALTIIEWSGKKPETASDSLWVWEHDR